MKVKYIGKKSDWLSFIENKVYEKIGESHGLWRVIDETGEAFLYGPKCFEVLSDKEYEELMKRSEYQPHKCPICGGTEFSMMKSGELCKICGWFDYPEWNEVDEQEYKKLYEAGKAKHSDLKAIKEPPL